MDLRFIDSGRKRIDYLFQNVPGNPPDPTELQAHWASYLCVIISGYIESSVRKLLMSYALDRAPKEVGRYACSQLSQFQNARADRILNLVRTFNPEWEYELKDFIDDERLTAINSIIGNRHNIAHGDGAFVTISSLKNWYIKANEVIDFLVALCQR